MNRGQHHLTLCSGCRLALFLQRILAQRADKQRTPFLVAGRCFCMLRETPFHYACRQHAGRSGAAVHWAQAAIVAITIQPEEVSFVPICGKKSRE